MRASISTGFVVAVAALLIACNGESRGGEVVQPPGNGDPPGDGGPMDPPPPPPPPMAPATPALEQIATGVGFPVFLTAPAGDPRLFIVDKRGTVRVWADGALLSDPFLDIRNLVSTGGEQGLLSMAFHSGYAVNGRFFVDYTDTSGDTRVVEYRVSGDPDRADQNPVRTILAVDQPLSNHNGGQIIFGPDGMLYIALGDGGGAGDPFDSGQDLATLLGSLLRIDVDAAIPFAIPPDNPFVGDDGARDEIWAFGLRNPWKFSFDRSTGTLYIGDVGQADREEINASPPDAAGLNYGWNTTEGTLCFDPRQGCDRTGLTEPVLEYDHGDGCSVTGGYVYRGAALPDLDGAYFYSDFCAGFVRSFRLAGGTAVDRQSWPDLAPPEANVTSFGEDAAGELYILTRNGNVYKIVPDS